jgi:hypothetical protein
MPVTSPRGNDEHFYEAAAEELLESPRNGLLIKCAIEAEGDSKHAQLLYIRYRVEELQEEYEREQQLQRAEIRRQEDEIRLRRLQEQRAKEAEVAEQEKSAMQGFIEKFEGLKHLTESERLNLFQKNRDQEMSDSDISEFLKKTLFREKAKIALLFSTVVVIIIVTLFNL